ncbi:SGNH/GDSL hydrolase family protein [Gordonia alkanivorans]|uniref:SGNH/GDSL hydrolase family protein n=1 Tax=Gordonia alkanivorans TaxID=84096 RepID=UPI001FC90160|nr:SGNH/GDSL hydrolase family protein [Gordonia alkanivorans]MDH3022942.1 SGNH/GDSL hydrolase family protein [Gordonia alkanivorans]MDH3059841.1 SGNH/GDSL hydrolase family protein [Gordonia alkanivorans]
MTRVVTAAIAMSVVVGLGAAPALAAPSAGERRSLSYVALGDSRAASPTTLTQFQGCSRSETAYPNLLAKTIAATSFRTVACVGARGENITTAPQLRFDGFHPPQIEAVRPDTDLITISIGANDANWGNLSRWCIAPIQGMDSRCRTNPFYVTGINDGLRALEASVDSSLEAVRKRAPKAVIAVIGQGGYFGDRGCYPANPASDADIRFIRNGFLARYNTILEKVSGRHGAVFVDIQNRVVGHDACSGDKWFEGFVPTSIYLGFHQNLKGNEAMARLIAEALPEDLGTSR